MLLVRKPNEDNLGQLFIGLLTSNDFSELYSFIPNEETALGLQVKSTIAIQPKKG